MLLPTLYKVTSKGQVQTWRVWVEGADFCTEYGLRDGKKQQARKEAKGKNIGKANETTPSEQAQSEAAAIHKKGLDTKYSFRLEEDLPND